MRAAGNYTLVTQRRFQPPALPVPQREARSKAKGNSSEFYK